MTVADVNAQIDQRRANSITATGGLGNWVKLPTEDRVRVVCDGDFAWKSDERSSYSGRRA